MLFDNLKFKNILKLKNFFYYKKGTQNGLQNYSNFLKGMMQVEKEVNYEEIALQNKNNINSSPFINNINPFETQYALASNFNNSNENFLDLKQNKYSNVLKELNSNNLNNIPQFNEQLYLEKFHSNEIIDKENVFNFNIPNSIENNEYLGNFKKFESNHQIINDQNNNPEENLDYLQKQKGEFELIIKPTEGIQTTFYSIKENGGKIGRHSCNQIVILEESVSRYHAEIGFENKKFYLRDIGSTTGTFLKIHTNIVLEEEMIIEMGSNQFLIESIINNVMKIVVLEGPNQDEIFNISLKDHNSKFLIGRKNTNDMHFEDHHLSNLHARIYLLNNNYILEDLSSTNGYNFKLIILFNKFAIFKFFFFFIKKKILIRSWRRLSKEGEKSQWFPLNNATVFKVGSSSTYSVNCNWFQEKNVENEEIKSKDCIICYENDRDCLYLPCRHNTACMKCSKNLTNCPICKVKIEEFIKIYRS